MNWRARHSLTLLLLLCVLCVVTLSQSDRRITFYTPQTSYTLSVLDRNSTEYVGVLEALEPLGPVTGRPDGKKYKFKFRDIEAQFENGKTKAKIHGNSIELSAPFVLENNRGFVPVASLKDLLSAFAISPTDVHDTARRVFIGGTSTHVTARRSDSAKVVFTFSAPVNPFIATEPGKLRMTFDREPLQSEIKYLTFDDKTIPSAAYSETNGAAELTITGSAPLTASFSDDRKTITISAIVPAVQQAPSSSATNTSNPTSSPPQPGTTPSQNAAAAPRLHAYVIIDAAHGGTDRGSSIGNLAEKDITLALAHRIRHELEVRGIPSGMVRDGDAALTPDQRASIVNSSNAVLYISLHASATGLGVRVFSSTVPAQPRSTLAFVPVHSVQASASNQSRNAATIMAQSLAARELRAANLPAFVTPLNNIAIPAVAIEIAPSSDGSPDTLGNPSYQQSIASSITSAIAAVQAQLPREVPQ